MLEKKKLPRTKQCAKCPWKKSTNPHEIPDGYCTTKHRNLKNTIADQDNPLASLRSRNAMACHHSTGSDGMYCIGWLANQLGPGNNVGLRLKMMKYDLSKVKLVGEQHDRFEDTLPPEEYIHD